MRLGILLAMLLGGGTLATSQWVAINSGLNGHVRVLIYDSLTARLYVFGHFTEAGNGLIVNGTTYYEDNEWHSMGAGVDNPGAYAPKTAALSVDSVMITGSFQTMVGIPNTERIALWNGEEWQSIGGTGANGAVWGIMANEEGWVVGGAYSEIGGISSRRLARYHNGTWENLCMYPDMSESAAYASIIKYQGNYVVGGNIHNFPGINEIGVLIDDTLRAMGPGVLGDAWVNDMKVYHDELYVAGEFYSGAGNPGSGIMKWNGSEWSDPVPGVQYITQVHDLDVYDDKLFIGGRCMLPGSSDYYTLAMYTPGQLCLFGMNINAVMNAIAGAPGGLYVVPNVPSLVVDGVPLDRLAFYDTTQGYDTCIALPTSVDELMHEAEDLHIYPNPTTGTLTLALPGNVSGTIAVSVFDAQGKLALAIPALSVSGSAPVELELGDLPFGMYLLRVEQSQRTYSSNITFILE